MDITARVRNAGLQHDVEVSAAGVSKRLTLPARGSEGGSAVNGGELLMLALATCYCNDLYREATRLGMVLRAVEVQASADFAGRGLGATNIRYKARIDTDEPHERVLQLLRETDAVAEVNNTLRSANDVALVEWSETV